MANSLACGGCGFVHTDRAPSAVPAELRDVVASFARLLDEAPNAVAQRPEPDRWSVLEYAAHLRDVLLSLRERLILGLLIDDAVGTPIYRDERVNRGLYANDTAAELQVQLRVAADILSAIINTMPDSAWSRTMVYSPVSDATVDLAWIANQGLHEAVHHLGDARDNLA